MTFSEKVLMQIMISSRNSFRVNSIMPIFLVIREKMTFILIRHGSLRAIKKQ